MDGEKVILLPSYILMISIMKGNYIYDYIIIINQYTH